MITKSLWSAGVTCRATRILFLLITALAVAMGVLLPARAEDPSPRNLITRVMPNYPAYLRERDIGGVVRLTVVVTPAGNVKSVTPIGGNPILVDAAIDAVKRWKYAPGDNVDTFEVKVEFTPHKVN